MRDVILGGAICLFGLTALDAGVIHTVLPVTMDQAWGIGFVTVPLVIAAFFVGCKSLGLVVARNR